MNTTGNHEPRCFELPAVKAKKDREAYARWEELFLSKDPHHRQQALEILAADPPAIVNNLKAQIQKCAYHQREHRKFLEWLQEGSNAASIGRLLGPEYDADVSPSSRRLGGETHPYHLVRVLCEDIANFLEGGVFFGQSSYKVLLRHPLLNRKQRRQMTKKKPRKADDLAAARQDKKKQTVAERFGLKGWEHRIRRSAMIYLDELAALRPSGRDVRTALHTQGYASWYSGRTPNWPRK
jgi:hypothetical protein